MTLTDEHLPDLSWFTQLPPLTRCTAGATHISANVASWSTECRPNKGAVVRPKVIDYVSLIDSGNHLIAAMRVRPIVITWAKEKISVNLVCQKRKDRPTWTGNGTPVQLNVDFLTGMSEAKQAAGNSRHRIALIVHPRKVGNL
jgi:hypothetical protein